MSGPTIWSTSACVAARCKPVAIRIVIPSAADSRLVKPIKQGRKRDGIGRRSSDIADHDGDPLLAFGKVADRSRCQRMIESLLQSSVRIGKRLYVPALDDGTIVAIRDG